MSQLESLIISNVCRGLCLEAAERAAYLALYGYDPRTEATEEGASDE